MDQQPRDRRPKSQFTTKYFIPPFGAPIGVGVIGALISLLIGIFSIIFRVAPVFGDHIHGHRSSPEFFEGPSAVYVGLFFVFTAGWLHVLDYWSHHDRLNRYAPVVSNTLILVALATVIVGPIVVGHHTD
ncbi:MAG: hypothetical protein JJU36_01530 [Phycisphaeraceae bacterium]|nr:hypothetical protein [Phycisphaeraceae bacterium]